MELTQNCNLCCRYCIYDEENESYRDFSLGDIGDCKGSNRLFYETFR